jgi:hypothetical protein
MRLDIPKAVLGRAVPPPPRTARRPPSPAALTTDDGRRMIAIPAADNCNSPQLFVAASLLGRASSRAYAATWSLAGISLLSGVDRASPHDAVQGIGRNDLESVLTVARQGGISRYNELARSTVPARDAVPAAAESLLTPLPNGGGRAGRSRPRPFLHVIIRFISRRPDRGGAV